MKDVSSVFRESVQCGARMSLVRITLFGATCSGEIVHAPTTMDVVVSLRGILALLRVRRRHLARELVQQCVVNERIYIHVSTTTWSNSISAILDEEWVMWRRASMLGYGMYEGSLINSDKRYIDCRRKPFDWWHPRFFFGIPHVDGDEQAHIMHRPIVKKSAF